MPSFSISQPLDHASDVLARAYFDDPALTYILPSPEARVRDIGWLIDVAVRYGDRFGKVFTTGSPAVGTALCLPPGETTITPDRLDQVGFAAAPARLGPEAFARFNHLVGNLVGRHVAVLPEPHWYLMMLGVDPPQLRQGIGSQLLQEVLERAAVDKVPCYIETGQQRNVGLLARRGFSIVDEMHLPDMPRMWLMAKR